MDEHTERIIKGIATEWTELSAFSEDIARLWTYECSSDKCYVDECCPKGVNYYIDKQVNGVCIFYCEDYFSKAWVILMIVMLYIICLLLIIGLVSGLLECNKIRKQKKKKRRT